MKKIILLVLPLFICFSCGEYKNGGAENLCNKETANVFLIIGQSNAASRAFSVEEYRNDNIFVLNGSGEWQNATQALNCYSTIEPGKCDRHSFGWSFSNKYLDEHEQIRIISNAKGGTSIDFWQKGSKGYDKTIKRVLPFKNKVLAILFHQGESNAETPYLWQDGIETMVNDFRIDLGFNVPFIFGQISSVSKYEYYNTFNSAIFNLYSKIDNIKIVESNGITTMNDSIHFNKNGQLELGKRYYNAYNSSSLDKKSGSGTIKFQFY